MPPKVLMTQKQFGDHRGVGKSAVSNWKKADLLVFAEGGDGKLYVDVARSDAKLNARLDPMRGRPSAAASFPADEASLSLPLDGDAAPAPAPGASPAGESLQSVRIAESHERRIGLALKNARDAGDLAPRAELEQRAGNLGRAFRERMHSMFRGIAERLAAERDIRTIMALGEAEIDRVCAELADAADRGDFSEPEEAELEAEEAAEFAAAAAAEEAGEIG